MFSVNYNGLTRPGLQDLTFLIRLVSPMLKNLETFTLLVTNSQRTSNNHCISPSKIVITPDGKTSRLFGGSLRLNDVIKCLKKCMPFVPCIIIITLNQVLTLESRDRNKLNGVKLAADLLEVRKNLCHNLIVSVHVVWWRGCIDLCH